jgi:hypothetical protein
VRVLAWAPDGKSLVYSANEAGAVRLWRVALDGGAPRMLAPTDVADGGDVAWAPGRVILYCRSAYRSIGILDPETEAQHTMPIAEPQGELFAPVPSADGKRVAVFWKRLTKRGLWTIDVDTGAERLVVSEGALIPLVWSPDGAFIYATTYDKPLEVVRISSLGGAPEPVIDFPTDLDVSDVTAARDGSTFVVLGTESHSDVWLTGDIAADAVVVAARPAGPPQGAPGQLAAPLPAPENLDLEDGDAGGLPIGWHHSERSRWETTAALSDERPFHGKRCLRLDSKGDAIGEVVQDVDARPYQGQRLRVRAVTRAEVAPAIAVRLWLAVEYADGRVDETSSDDGHDAAREWTPREAKIDVRNGATRVSYGLALIGKGTAWIDAVSVEAGPEQR